MVPAGEPTQADASTRSPRTSRAGDTIVDGGNANYKDSQRRAAELARRGIQFVDCGVSGGVWGLENGYALMFGGIPRRRARRRALCAKVLAPAADRGWLHCGPGGFRPFRQDDPQRHRVRDDAGVRRRLRAAGRQARVRARHRRDRRDVAPRQRRALVAARPDRRIPRSATRRSTRSRRTSPIRARDAGPSPRRSSRACPRRCSRSR